MSSSKKKYRQFTLEFKQSLVQQIESGQISATAAAREHAISPALILNWRQKFQAGALSATPSKRERELEKELDEYKRLLAEAVAEREFLKKVRAQEKRTRRLSTCVISGPQTSRSPAGQS